MDRYIVKCTYAPPGTGKTWRRCAKFLVDEWLPFGGEGVHYSNFPIRMEDWKDAAGKVRPGLVSLASKRHGIKPEEVRRRVQVMPSEILDQWRTGRSGPWDYFRDLDLSGAHIAIDEAHSFWPSARVEGGPQMVDKLMHFLSEVRHLGSTIEFITQHPDQIHDRIKALAGAELYLTNTQDFRVPVLGFRVGDLADMVEVVTGRYFTFVRQDEYKKEGKGAGKLQGSDTHLMRPAYFDVYDSYSKPNQGGRSGQSAERTVVRLGRWGAVRYFCHRYAIRLCLIFACLSFVMYAAWGGRFMRWYFDGVQAIMAKATQMQAVRAGEATAEEEEEAKPVEMTLEALMQDVRFAAIPELQRRTVIQIMLDNVKLVEEREEVRTEYRALLSENQKLTEILNGPRSVVMLTPDGVGFSDGGFYSVGQIVQGGEFGGQRIEAVDYPSRSVRVGGQWVRVGQGQPTEVDRLPEVAESGGVVPGGVRTYRSILVNREDDGTERGIVDLERSGDAFGSVRPDGEQANSGVRRRL